MISGFVLKYLNGECFVIWGFYKYTLLASAEFNLTVPVALIRPFDFSMGIILRLPLHAVIRKWFYICPFIFVLAAPSIATSELPV